jgi:phosphoglycerate dehydrogenase-like enzyme
MSANPSKSAKVVLLDHVGIVAPVREIQDSVLPVGWSLDRIEGVSRTDALERLSLSAASAEALLVGDFDIDQQVIEAMPNLRIIQVFGVGFETIDLDFAASRGVAVCNAPGLNAIPVAEHTLLLALAAARSLPTLDREVRQGRWPQYDYRAQSSELAGKTWGVVGFGNIGRLVAVRAAGFDMHVLYYRVAHGPATMAGAEFAELNDLLERSHVVSLHVPLNERTRNIIGRHELRRMRPDAILVNTARGGLVDTDALISALSERWIAAAGLDVFDQEPLSPRSPLVNLPNVVLSPHTSAGTRETTQRMFAFCYANIERGLGGGRPLNCVNGL